MSRSRTLGCALLAVLALLVGFAPGAQAASRHRPRPHPVAVTLPASALTGQAVPYVVRETPGVRRRALVVQLRPRGQAWRTVARTSEGAKGLGRATLSFATSGTYDVRTLLTRRGKHAARVAPTRSIAVTPSNRPRVVAHRGGGGAGPGTENTMVAFQRALSVGATALETDVQATAPDPMTGKSRLILMHDPTLARTTDVAEKFPGRQNDAVSTFTPAEIDQIRTRSNPALPISSLSDLLALAAAHPEVSLRIEAKVPGIESQMVDAVRAAGLESDASSDRVIFTSFDDEDLKDFRRLDPDANVQLTAKNNSHTFVSDALAVGATWVSLHLSDVTPAVVAQIHQAGLRVDAYTVRNASDTYPLADAGVDAVTTDAPAVVLGLFAG